MKSGETRLYAGKQGRSLLVCIGVWAVRDKSGTTHIHLTSRRHFHVTVTDRAGRKRYHPALFKALKGLLAKNGRWKFEQ